MVRPSELPSEALLRRYLDVAGAYVDCYLVEIPGVVSHAQYVEAFYTTGVFKLERFVLAALVKRPSTDEQARSLGSGEIASFAAWTVESRAPKQLLLCDLHGRTRSWLMTEQGANEQSTRLYFGSAVVPIVQKRSGQANMGTVFNMLLGFHKLYSRVLLRAAVARLSQQLRV